MKKFFNETDLMKMKELKDMQEQYDYFLMIHKQGIRSILLKRKRKTMVQWKELKRKSTKHGRELIENRFRKWKKIIQTREKEKRYENYIIHKCKEEPKLIYSCICGKINVKQI